MTFSILAVDTENNLIGSAVASKWTGVGGCVPYFKPGIGLVNVQNHSDARVAYNILDEIEKDSRSLENCMVKALEADSAHTQRQCILLSLENTNFHVYSGSACTGIHHHKIGKQCAAAGNTLATPKVIDAMVNAFEDSINEPIAERLIRALEAGQDEGGDVRGQEAAAIKVYKATYPDQRFFPVDLRIDHHEKPLEALRYLYEAFLENERRIIR